MSERFDFVIVGAGIMGLAIARELRKRHPSSSIALLEKENTLGKHASGRNSGVLHSGIYYPAGSLKAKLCAEGAREMAAYCKEHHLPLKRSGKVILPVEKDQDSQIEVLLSRATANGARAFVIGQDELTKIEPFAVSCTGRALHSPDTALVNPLEILNHLEQSLQSTGVLISKNTHVEEIQVANSLLKTTRGEFSYGYLFNTAGVFADVIARKFGIAQKYSILPFRGSYYQLSEKSKIRINSLIYPVPDLRVPFLGVHFMRTIDNHTYMGPSATPALGRENYKHLNGINLIEATSIAKFIGQQYLKAPGFRRLVRQEARRMLKRNFAKDAQKMVPQIRNEDLVSCNKAGIRAQLLDLEKQELVMDFLVEHAKNSTHILNAVSPGFTSSLRFARYLLDEMPQA
jgi:(S)-2-hydroxyglutarate dehydrogenase